MKNSVYSISIFLPPCRNRDGFIKSLGVYENLNFQVNWNCQINLSNQTEERRHWTCVIGRSVTIRISQNYPPGKNRYLHSDSETPIKSN